MKYTALLQRVRVSSLPVLCWPFLAALAALCCALTPSAHATGSYDSYPVPTLPYYLDRLPAKTPGRIFSEAAPPTADHPPTDYPASLAALAKEAERSGKTPVDPVPLLARVDELLTRARIGPPVAPYCNLLNDVRDLFAAKPPVPGKDAAEYIRWRVANSGWFGLSILQKPPKGGETITANSAVDENVRTIDQRKAELARRAATKGPLQAHWLYAQAAFQYPNPREELFQKVVSAFPDHPRAESARFMIGRCRLNAARAAGSDRYGNPPEDPKKSAESYRLAREAFEDYLKRYPAGRFVADAKGWLAAVAFDGGDYPGALRLYLEQADTPGHPEVIKSAAFMCERCLSRISAKADAQALDEVAAHPKLAMSLIYLIVNTSEANNHNGLLETPAQMAKWRRALLPRLAKAVAAHESAYHDSATAGWHTRYLAILAQAASGAGDQTRALSLCDMAKAEIEHNDDLAFIQLVAFQRAHRLPEAIAAARAFAQHFPESPFLKGAQLRLALALQDNHQAGLALVELCHLHSPTAVKKDASADSSSANEPDYGDHLLPAEDDPTQYPSSDEELAEEASVLRHDVSGAEDDQINQIIDALLCFAPHSELTPALDAGRNLDGGAAVVHWRAVLAQRHLGDDENFAEARKYLTPAQWSVTAAGLEKLGSAAAAKPGDAEILMRLADGWAAARGKLVYAPMETDKTREALLGGATEFAGVRRRDNALALGLKPEAVDRALEGHDELRHAMKWWLKAADAAPVGSPTRARALWLTLKAMPSVAYASPYMLARANETHLSQISRDLCERLRRECPNSREAKEFAVYYDFPPAPKAVENDDAAADVAAASDDVPDHPPDPPAPAADNADPESNVENPALQTAMHIYGDTEYVYDARGAFDENPKKPAGESEASDSPAADLKPILERAVALGGNSFTSNPKRMAAEVAACRKAFRALPFRRTDVPLQNLLDDLTDLLKEDAAKLKPDVLKRYVALRLECVRVEAWGCDWGDTLPAVADIPGNHNSEGTLDDAVLVHIRAAYKAPGMAGIKDYLDFLALAVIANHNVSVKAEPPGLADKDGDTSYTSRDYPKLAKLADQFLTDHPHSGKREAARILVARALYNASRPSLYNRFAAWPESGHFQGGGVLGVRRREAFDPRKIGAALNAYDKEFPGGRYAAEIQNLRALLAWRTQAWDIALDLSLAAMDDKAAPDLQEEAGIRLANIFADGFTDETERMHLIAAVKARPAAVTRLRAYLKKCDYPLRMYKGWIEAQL